MPDPVRVLISYSHDSDAHRERVRALADRLRSDGVDAWIDQYVPAPVEGWPRWTEREFSKADFVVVACSEPYRERFTRPPGQGSGVGWEGVLIRQELSERGGNTRIVPVSFSGDDQVVPLILRPYTRYDLPADYEALLRHLVGEQGTRAPPLGPSRVFEGARPDPPALRAPVKLWNVPPRPEQYLPREDMDGLKASLISSKTDAPVAVAAKHRRLGIQGMGGVGKTVLAAALATDPDVHEAFPGGVFWLSISRTPDDVVVWQGKLAAALAGRPVEIRTAREGRMTLSELFAARPPSLLILDDVWNVADASPFNATTEPSRLLLTTRNRDVATGLGAEVRELTELKAEDALALLAAYSGRAREALPAVAADVACECGELPLALAMAGSMLRDRPDDRWPTLLERLRSADLGYLQVDLPSYEQDRSMLAVIEASVEDLPGEVQRRYLDFAVFAEDVGVPESVLHLVWKQDGVDKPTAQRSVDLLLDRSLLRRDAEGRLTLHDLQHDYLRAKAGDLRPFHTRLLDAYRTTSGGALSAVTSDGYFYEHAARHVIGSEGPAALRALLFDLCWLTAKLRATDLSALLGDFERCDLEADPPLRLIWLALRLSSGTLTAHPEQLPGQLIGRLGGSAEAELRDLRVQGERSSLAPLICPLLPSLTPPTGASQLLQTFKGHTKAVWAIALSGDGRTVMSASPDGTLWVWDVRTGRSRMLQRRGFKVRAVALSGDGHTAMSASEDAVLKVWDLPSGRVVQTQECGGLIEALALSEDGRIAILGGPGHVPGVWDLAPGGGRGSFGWHRGPVGTVALSGDGKTAVSGADDAALMVWDVGTRREVWTLKGHQGGVTSVALSKDGKVAVSGGVDGTLRVWDVTKGELLRTMSGHGGHIHAVALTWDGKTAISGANDFALKVWNVPAGKVLQTLAGHRDEVLAVALTGDGKTAVSGSADGTLKVWNVVTSEVPETEQPNMESAGSSPRRSTRASQWSAPRFYPELAPVESLKPPRSLKPRPVALSRDGTTAAAGAEDVLKIWDMVTGRVSWTLEGHEGHVSAVALSEDGKLAVSGSRDTTLKVWDLTSGKEVRTIGSASCVNVVALSNDGKIAISDSGECNSLEVWDVTSGRVLLESNLNMRFGSFLGAMAVSLDEKTAIFAFRDGRLVVWNMTAGTTSSVLQGEVGWMNGVGLSADGGTAVFGWDTSLAVWNIAAEKSPRYFKGHTGAVLGAALSLDGRTAVSASYDATVKAWDVATGTCLASFTGESGFTAVAMDRGRRIVASDQAGRVHLLALRLGERAAGSQVVLG